MHFGIFDWPCQSNIPKYIFWFSKTRKSKYAFLDTPNYKIEICSFGFLTDQNSKIKTYILGYLTSQHQSNIPKWILWFSKTRQLNYAFWDISNCNLKYVVLDYDGPKLENQNMPFWIFVKLVPVKYPKMHILIFQN